jgi:hypothetical protein
VRGQHGPYGSSAGGDLPIDHANDVRCAQLSDAFRPDLRGALAIAKYLAVVVRHARKGVPHLKVSGKGGKTRYLALHPGTKALIHRHLNAAGHDPADSCALFTPK